MTDKLDPKLNPFLIVRPILNIETNKILNGQETVVQVVADLDDQEECQVDMIRFSASVNATLRTDYCVRVNDQIWASFSSNRGADSLVAYFLQSTQTLAGLREKDNAEYYSEAKNKAMEIARATFAGDFE
jgi:hypothetical protein